MQVTGTFSDPSFHGMLLADQPRCRAYRDAIAQAVIPGQTVLDVGAGSGILSLYACRAGARHVYAAERTPIVKLARQLAVRNGLGDQITFLAADLRDIDLPERVDVIVSELISQSIFGQHMERLTAFARDRFLAERGKILPERVEFFAAPVDASSEIDKRWPPQRTDGLDLGVLRKMVSNQLMAVRLSKLSMLAGGHSIYRYDAYTNNGEARIDIQRRFQISRAGTLSGVAIWFVADMYAGLQLDNRDDSASWSNILFPMGESIAVAPGMWVDFSLRGFEPMDAAPQFEWKFAVRNAGSDIACHESSCSTIASAWMYTAR